jgi:hypothetical protein
MSIKNILNQVEIYLRFTDLQSDKYPLMRDENKTKIIVFSHVFACNSMDIDCIASP